MVPLGVPINDHIRQSERDLFQIEFSSLEESSANVEHTTRANGSTGLHDNAKVCEFRESLFSLHAFFHG